MNPIYRRILTCKSRVGLTWDQIATQAKIKQASWMTGLPTSQPTDEELRKLAPVLETTYEWLKNGDKE